MNQEKPPGAKNSSRLDGTTTTTTSNRKPSNTATWLRTPSYLEIRMMTVRTPTHLKPPPVEFPARSCLIGVGSARSTLSGCWSKNQEHKRQDEMKDEDVLSYHIFLAIDLQWRIQRPSPLVYQKR